MQDPAPEIVDEAGPLRNRDEFVRKDRAVSWMGPAQQRLDPDQTAGDEIDLRLICHRDLVERHRFVQSLLEGSTAPDFHVERSVEHLDAVPAFLLGPVHRNVAVAQQRADIVAILWTKGATDRNADEHPVADQRYRLQETVLDSLRQRQGTFRIDIGQPQRELVAAHPCHHRIAAQAGFQPLGNHSQQRVAGSVSQRVVDVLEVIEIEVEQRQGAPRALVGFDLAGQTLGQQHTVGQAGQRIMRREMGEPGLHLPPVLHLGPERISRLDGFARRHACLFGLPLGLFSRSAQCRHRQLPLAQKAKLI